jgi:hypothetical protein
MRHPRSVGGRCPLLDHKPGPALVESFELHRHGPAYAALGTGRVAAAGCFDQFRTMDTGRAGSVVGQPQADDRQPFVRFRRRVTEVLQVTGHRLLGLGQPVPHLLGPGRISRVKRLHQAPALGLPHAMGLNERREWVGLLEPVLGGLFHRRRTFELGFPLQEAPVPAQGPVEDAGQLLGPDSLKQVRSRS